MTKAATTNPAAVVGVADRRRAQLYGRCGECVLYLDPCFWCLLAGPALSPVGSTEVRA